MPQNTLTLKISESVRRHLKDAKRIVDSTAKGSFLTANKGLGK